MKEEEIKAKELINKFWDLSPQGYDRQPYYKYAKLCALIAVDEILKGDHLFRLPLKFWQNVRVAIEKQGNNTKSNLTYTKTTQRTG